MSKSRYNPTFDRDKSGEGKAFNYVPTQVLTEVTDKDRAEAQERVEAVIRQTHKAIGLTKENQ